MSAPWLLDAFCCAGGATKGYQQAGFRVVGVDINPQPNYCGDDFVQGDAVAIIRKHGHQFAAIHASPPCQGYLNLTKQNKAMGRPVNHPNLIAETRAALLETGQPYVIENVPGAPLEGPLRLCGSSFGLRVRRHRLFETNAAMLAPPCQHHGHEHVGVYGDHWDRPGGWLRPNGTSRGVKATSIADAQDAMGIDWITTWDDLTDAIPPAYTAWIGENLIALLAEEAA